MLRGSLVSSYICCLRGYYISLDWPCPPSGSPPLPRPHLYASTSAGMGFSHAGSS